MGRVKRGRGQSKPDIPVETQTSTTRPSLDKKMKRQLKSKAFVNKLQLIDNQKKDAKAKRQREKTPVVGDMKKLNDALVASIDKEALIKNKKLKKPKRLRDDYITKTQKNQKKVVKSRKARSYVLASETERFQNILKNPAFNANPFDAIKQHIANVNQIVKQSD